jgi:hypothetical protein
MNSPRYAGYYPVSKNRFLRPIEPRWKLTHDRLYSISGVPTEGHNLARCIYLDESGTCSEQTLVVAGVIINIDAQYEAIAEQLRGIARKYVPSLKEHEVRGFIFHAKDLFHGTGRTLFDRRKFDIDRSREALKELLAIPSKFHLPTPFGFIKQQQLPPKTQRARDLIAINHSIAFSRCVVEAERYMRRQPSELAMVIAENNDQTKEILKIGYEMLQGISEPTDLELWSVAYAGMKDFLPIKKIVHESHFADKNGAYLLQIADACAFIIRYLLEKKPGVEDLVEAFSGAFRIPPNEEVGSGIFNFEATANLP